MEEFPNTQTRILVADASTLAGASFPDLQDLIKDLHVTVLVNNVGGDIGRKNPFTYLEDHEPEEIDKLINLNDGFTTKLTRALLPTLSQNQPSTILNISSLASVGVPMLSVYGATKGYLLSFSEVLQTDLIKQGKDITVHGVLVGAVVTSSSGNQPGFFTPGARDMARETLSRAGKKPVTTAACWRHSLQYFLLSSIPQRMRQQSLMKEIEKLSQRALKNQ